jgi:hypothetical protein
MSKKNRFKRPKLWRSKPETPEAIEGFKPKDSRQQRRAVKRKHAFELLTTKYGGESRKVRRAMAIALAKRSDRP